MSDKTLTLTSNLYHYLLNNSLREPEILCQLRMKTQSLSASKMQVAPEQAQFMRLLIELMGATKTIDIGTFTGYSALAVALSLPANGKVIACDINTEWTDIAEHYWQQSGIANRIELRLAPALDTLNNLLESGQASTFDFIFIDADKYNYDSYYEKSLQLLKTGGLIAIDNVLWGGSVADSDVMDRATVSIRELNKKIVKDERVTISMLPIGDGLTLARKK